MSGTEKQNKWNGLGKLREMLKSYRCGAILLSSAMSLNMPKKLQDVGFPYLHVMLCKESINLHSSKLLRAWMGSIHTPCDFIRWQFSPSWWGHTGTDRSTKRQEDVGYWTKGRCSSNNKFVRGIVAACWRHWLIKSDPNYQSTKTSPTNPRRLLTYHKPSRCIPKSCQLNMLAFSC